MPDVSSNWKITLDPDGEALVLVDFGQRMSDELTWGWKQVVDEVKKQGGTTDHFPRGNVTGPVSFGSYKDHNDDAAAREWMALLFVALNDFTGARTTLKVEIQGGDIFTVSNVVLEEAPTKMVPTAPVARTLTTWKLRAGTWALSGTAEEDGGEVEGPVLYLTTEDGMLKAGGAEAGDQELIATWENGGTGGDASQATSGERPMALTGDGLYLPGVTGNIVEWQNHASLAPGNNFSARWDGVLPSYTPAARVCLLSKWSSTNLMSWAFYLEPDGTLTLAVSTDGTAATVTEWSSLVPVGVRPGVAVGLQFVKNLTVLSFFLYSGADDTSSNTLLGPSQTISNLTAANVVSPVVLGAVDFASNMLRGRVHRVQYWNTATWFATSTLLLRDWRAVSGASVAPIAPSTGVTGTNPLISYSDPLARFDGSDDSLELAEPVPLNEVTAATVMWSGILYRITGTQDLLFCGTAGSDPRILLRLNGDDLELHVRRVDAEAAAVLVYPDAVSYGGSRRFGAVVDYENGTATIYSGGAPKVHGALTSAGPTAATDSSETRVMAGAAGANPTAGDFISVFIAERHYDTLQMEELFNQY